MRNYGGETEAARLRNFHDHRHMPVAAEERSMIWCATCDARLTRGARVAGCRTCDTTPAGAMMPPHFASPQCESGHGNHCTCNTCF